MTRHSTAGDAAVEPADARAFRALMARLRVDGAGPAGYETLRRRLIQYFRLHLPEQAEELTDIALERLGRKIDEGTDVEQLRAYALGVARMVVREAHARLALRQRAEADPVFSESVAGQQDRTADVETLARLLDSCLQALGNSGADLILAYYGGADDRIATRNLLAQQHRISMNALRNRALRLRELLQRCLGGRLGDRTAP